jgi:hypothetical protein
MCFLKKKHTYTHIIEVFDIETLNGGSHLTPYCITYTDKDKTYLHFFSIMSADEVCEFIFKEFKTDVTYYAHNLSFDF